MYFDCVFVALVTNHRTPMRHIVIYGLPGCTKIFQTISQRARFSKKLLNIKCGFRFSLQILTERFLIVRKIEQDKIKMYIGLHVKHPLFLSDF